ncbi:MAG: WD40 repeat domain-containing protein [Chloroherpetonaceae bacterium]|nr:WD40 repeat domain-containing protein [Chloroherpetonaceae bacterium]
MATFHFPATFYQQQVPNLGHSLRVNSIVFTPDGKKIISASWKIVITSAETGEEIKTILLGSSSRDVIDSLAVAPDSKTIAVGMRQNHLIQIWDVESEKNLATLVGHKKMIRSLLFTSNGSQLISAGYEGKIFVWDMKTMKLNTTLKSSRNGVTAVSIDREGRKLAAGSPDGEIKLWLLPKGKLVFSSKQHKNLVSALTFNKDGSKLASASWDTNIGVWNTETGECETVLSGHKNGVDNIAFSQDNKALMSSSYNRIDKLGTMIFWQLLTGKPVHTLVGNFYRQTLSPDSSTVVLVSANGTVKTLLNATPEEFLESEIRRRERRLDERRRGELPFQGKDRRETVADDRRRGSRRTPKTPSDTKIEIE